MGSSFAYINAAEQQQQKKCRRVEDFPWIFSAIAFHCVVVFFYIFWLKIVVDISTRFNANKSIIYNSHTDLSSSLFVWVCKNDEKIWILQSVPSDSCCSEGILRQMIWANLMRLMNLVQYSTGEKTERRFLTENSLLSFGMMIERGSAPKFRRWVF